MPNLFPFIPQNSPFYLEKGAYDPTAVYSTADIQDIVQNHNPFFTFFLIFPNWLHVRAYQNDPSLTVRCPAYEHNINNIPLDPTQTHTYQVLEGNRPEVRSFS